MSERTGSPNVVDVPTTASILGLTTEAVEALARAGFLAPTRVDGVVGFTHGDIKAFQARNADNGSGNLFLSEPGSVDAADLLEALDDHSEDMARRALEIFTTVFPDTATWTEDQRNRFVDQARARFEALLAVASQGAEVDEALVDDLREVGAAAAWSGSSLPQLLVVLRISRDLVVQTAIELVDERGRHWSLPLALVLTRVLPAMDRLIDSLAQGYWDAVVGREAEHKARYEHVVEHSSDGVYEVDLDGCVQYANPSLALILGRSLEELDGARLTDVLVPLGGGNSLESLTSDAARGSGRTELVVVRPDGVRRVLEVRTSPRRQDDELVGFQGVVRDVTTSRDLEADKNEFLALMTYDLRQPLTTMLGFGATLEAHADELGFDRIKQIGGLVRSQAERMARLADDLYDISRLESQSLLLSPRPVDVGAAIDAAIARVPDGAGLDVKVKLPPGGVEVVADPRRLEQVIANLVENALAYGAPPIEIVVDMVGSSGQVEIAVIDHGTGVPPALVPSLFNRLRLLARRDRDRTRGTGLGLSLVKGLVEAMGGRVWYEQSKSAGADFRFTLPTLRNR